MVAIEENAATIRVTDPAVRDETMTARTMNDDASADAQIRATTTDTTATNQVVIGITGAVDPTQKSAGGTNLTRRTEPRREEVIVGIDDLTMVIAKTIGKQGIRLIDDITTMTNAGAAQSRGTIGTDGVTTVRAGPGTAMASGRIRWMKKKGQGN